MQNESSLHILTCSIDFYFFPDEAERGLQLLLSSAGIIESKTGCKACSITRDTIDPARVSYKETWGSESAFDRHAQSAEFRRVLIAMELCREEPTVVIGNLSGHSGLTYLQRLCSGEEAFETVSTTVGSVADEECDAP